MTGRDFQWMDLVHVDDRAATRQAIADVVTGRTEHVESAFRVVGSNSAERWLRAVFRRERNGSDDLLGFFMGRVRTSDGGAARAGGG